MGRLLAVAMAITLFAGALAAQQDIDVQVPVGTSVLNGHTENDGKSANGDIISYTVRIANAGSSNLALTGSVVQGSGYKNVQVNLTNVPAAQSLAPAGFLDFDISVDPDKDSDWSFNVTITSDDPTDPSFVLKFKGTQGKPKKDEGCSTSDSSGTSILMLLALASAGVVATRLRRSHA
ncbi:MAG: hypothetical protein H6839_06880 [Planctomycetes bacterium]|nr:hypothetical protein [Planctomycetota bacterium]